MGKTLKHLQTSHAGMMGIGALIIFLAIVLVAAIAASVLITTGGSLQQKALITGNEAREGVGSGIDIISIKGSDASSSGTPHSLSRLQLMSRLPPGSNPLAFNNTIITMDTTSGSQNYLYGGVVDVDAIAPSTGVYVISYVKAGPNQINHYLNVGDMVNVKFNIAGGLGELKRTKVTIIPQVGNMNQLEFVTPETMTEPVVSLWPTG
jgi:archaeal flagellin FlaB